MCQCHILKPIAATKSEEVLLRPRVSGSYATEEVMVVDEKLVIQKRNTEKKFGGSEVEL